MFLLVDQETYGTDSCFLKKIEMGYRSTFNVSVNAFDRQRCSLFGQADQAQAPVAVE